MLAMRQSKRQNINSCAALKQFKVYRHEFRRKNVQGYAYMARAQIPPSAETELNWRIWAGHRGRCGP